MKAIIAGALILLAALCFIFGAYSFTTPTAEDSLRSELSANWDFELPEGYEVIYRKSGRGGFHGDGNTYTVIEYPIRCPMQYSTGIPLQSAESFSQTAVQKRPSMTA